MVGNIITLQEIKMSEQNCDTAGGGYWAGVGYGMSLDNLLTSAVTSASGWWFQPI